MLTPKPDVFILDGAYKAFDVIDEYESFIWTERYIGHGDFKLVCQPSEKAKKLLKRSNFIRVADTDFVMKIESILESQDEGKKLLTVTGRTLTYLLAKRGISPSWVGSGVIGNVITSLVTIICKDGTGISPYDAIPGFYTENLTTDTTVIDTKPEKASNLYDTLKSLCDAANVGFRIITKFPNGVPQIWFQVYNGVERKNLIFSPDMDTLIDPSYLESDEKFANIAYVWHQQGVRVVSRLGTPHSVSGYDRHVITVNAEDIQPADHVPEVYDKLLIQRGVEAMASENGRLVKLYDGEVPLDIPYEYRKDYFLGDIVTYSGTDITQKRKARVTEYIRSFDSQGIKSYPTFKVVDE
ncbi:minor tail protein [Arthrobacter phage Correa]|uniref:Minor tail protein n=1 Tax=Arthrobacter phage Correa TaxID=2024275 RepID=A0A222Z7P0_9CAUD|nr:minor tail protein [Arthrobacter phage Correa]ASR80084.1 minor tail protein [Arthrobacter phage Correa]